MLWKVWRFMFLTGAQCKQAAIHSYSHPSQFIETTSSKNHLKEITCVYCTVSSEKCPTWASPAPKAIKFLLKRMIERVREKKSPWQQEARESHGKQKALTSLDTRCHQFVLEFSLWKSKASVHNFLWEPVAPPLLAWALSRAERASLN